MLNIEEVYSRLKCCYVEFLSKQTKNIEKLIFDEALDCKVRRIYSLLKIKSYIQEPDYEDYIRSINEVCGFNLGCNCCDDDTKWIGIDPICEESNVSTSTTTTSTTTSSSTTSSSTTSSTTSTTKFSPPPIPTTTTTSTSTTTPTTTSTTTTTTTTTSTTLPGTTSTTTTTTSTSTTTSVQSFGDMEMSTYFAE